MLRPTLRRPKAGALTLILISFLLPFSCRGAGSKESRAKSPSGDPSILLLRARNILDEGKADEALLLLDTMRRRSKAFPASLRFRFELLYGQAYLAFARELRRKGANGLSIQANYQDAANHLQKAAQLAPKDPRPFLWLAKTYKDQGLYAEGAAAGFKALAHLDESTAKGERARAALLTSENLYGELTSLRRKEGSRISKASKDLANKLYETIDPALGFPDTRGRAYQLYAWSSQWIGDPSEGFGVLTDALREEPEDFQLQQTFFNFIIANRKIGDALEFYRQWIKDLAQESDSPKALALTNFYLGSTEAALGDNLRKEGDRRGANAAFAKAKQAFLRAAQLPAFAKNSRIRAALTHISRADLAISAGELDQARKELAAAYKLAPEVAQVDPNGIDHYFDGARKTYRGLLFKIGARLIGEGLEKALNYWRFVTQKHPTWGPAWNNLGLTARDLGVRIARSGQIERAKSLWEESFAAYKKAVQFSGNDPRIVNDCGLMLVYHLKRDYPEARKLLHKAIEIGQAQLDEMPESDPNLEPRLREKRRRIEEAVGDAWQNLGVLEENLGHPEKAIPFYKKAIQFFPKTRRSAASRLALLEKKKNSGFFPYPRNSFDLVFPRRLEDLAPLPFQLESDLIKALELAKQGNFQEAFTLLSPLIRKAGKNPEPWFVAGRTALLFAQSLMQRRERGARNYLAEAIDRLEKAEARILAQKKGGEVFGLRIHVLPAFDLCQAYILNGETDKAATLAARHLKHLDSLGTELPQALLTAFYLRISSVAARKAIGDLSRSPKSKDSPPSFKTARAWILKCMKGLKALAKDGGTLDLQSMEEAVGLPVNLPAFAKAWKDMELWARQPKEAISALGQIMAFSPKKLLPPLLTELSQVVTKYGGAEEAIKTLEPLEKRFPKDPTLAWYKGYFFYILGNERRMDPKKGDPIQAYTLADKALSDSSKYKPSFKGSADYWRAATQTGIGFYYATKGRNKDAKKAWFKALSLSDKAATEYKDPLIRRTAKVGILGLGAPFFRNRDFEGGAALFEEASKARPGDVDFWNNLGLFLREAGRTARDPQKAKKLFERSWKAYNRARLLEPRNVRLLNDTALVDVHYLSKYPREAEDLLRQAIKLGKKAFEKKSKDRVLEEALGDSYMNLGILLMKDPNRLKEAEVALRESWNYYPYRRRATGRHLKELESIRKGKKKGGREKG